jgi:hypothetical protein
MEQNLAKIECHLEQFRRQSPESQMQMDRFRARI